MCRRDDGHGSEHPGTCGTYVPQIANADRGGVFLVGYALSRMFAELFRELPLALLEISQPIGA